jgi:hypothetical protein
LLQGHIVLSASFNLCKYALVLPCPVTIAVKFVFMLIFSLIVIVKHSGDEP